MRVSCGNERARPSAATRSSCAGVRAEKNGAWPRTSTGFSLLANKLFELGELVFLHEDGVLGAGIAARAHVVAVVGQSLLEDRHEVDIDLGVARHVRFVQVEQIRADDVHAVRAVAGAEIGRASW